MEDVTSRLFRLDQLRASGTISEAEFDKLKDKLINDSLSGAPAAFSPIASEPLDEDPPAWRRLVVPTSAILVVLIVIFGFPLVSEGAGNECAALEQGAVRKFAAQDDDKSPANAFAAGFITLLQRASNGAFASNAAKARYPNLPPAMACTMAYYRMTFGGTPDLSSSPDKTASTESAPADQAPPQTDTSQPVPESEPQRQATISPERPAPPQQETSPAPEQEASPAIEPQRNVVDVELRPITRTHLMPPYPPISMRLGEQGVTTLDIQVNGSGDCVSAAVIRTSGSERLDMAAAEFVKSRWKWEPMPELGGQLKASTMSIAWSLKDAQ